MKTCKENDGLTKYNLNGRLSFKENIELYLKPSDRPWLNLTIFIVDLALSNAFYVLHIFYILDERFKDERGHVMHTLLGFGFVSFAMIYAFTDGMHYLNSYVDKSLYLMSCLMQKPILMPLLMPNRFNSKIATKQIHKHSHVLVDD